MKKLWILMIFGMICILAVSGQSSAANLDAAIKQASGEISRSMLGGLRVALLNFNSPSGDLSDYVIKELTHSLGQGASIKIVERADVDRVLREMKLQSTSEISDSSARQVGQKLGAVMVVTGSLVKTGENYSFRNRVIDVGGSVQPKSIAINVRDNPHLRQLLGQAATPATPAPAAAAPAAPAPAPAASPAPARVPAQQTLTAYKIGDTGPAGGLIFYDKGNNSNGWRYLEAAPSDINRQLNAVSETINTNDCAERAVGRGKTNTAAIMKEAANKGGGFGWAAQACDTFTLNGFSDWFLPSRDELNYMYGNLHMQGLGDFRSEWYWSSTGNGGNTVSFWKEQFSNGQQTTDYRELYRVRPIRQVPGQ